MKTPVDVFQACTIEANIVRLPDVQLERALYSQVAKKLGGIGGKWNRAENGFVFASNPADLLAQLAEGKERNLKKEYQFFPTPEGLAARMARLAGLQPGTRILEPSAGQGALLRAIERFLPDCLTDHCELMPENRDYLSLHYPWSECVGENFMQFDRPGFYNSIIANPPFARNQDISHVHWMYRQLAPGGRIVSIMSTHWQFAQEQTCVDFRRWLDEFVDAEVKELEPTAFRQSGTDVRACIVVIDKPFK